MITLKTFKRLIKYQTKRVHYGHYSQKDKNFNGEDQIIKKMDLEPKDIILKKIEESNGNWHFEVELAK